MTTYFVANWKMYGNRRDVVGYCQSMKSYLKNRNFPCSIIIAPPFTLLSDFAKEFATGFAKALTRQATTQQKDICIHNKVLSLAGQDISRFSGFGQHTGEVSAQMLKDVGTEFVIIGHGERRYLGETDNIIAKKVKTALKAGLRPIICIGENSNQKASGLSETVIIKQLEQALSLCTQTDLRENQPIIAYEPLWAIGSSAPMHELELQRIVASIKNSPIYHSIPDMPILYGGSVGENNVKELLTSGKVNGVLIGRKSLNPVELCHLIDTATNP